MRIVSPLAVNATIRLVEPAGTLRPDWFPGQVLQATVLPGQGNLVRLTIGDTALWAEWAGQLPAPTETVQLQVVGQEQDVWRMVLLTAAEPPVIFLPKLLERLGLELSYDNLERVRRSLQRGAGEPLAGADQAGLFPLDEPIWRDLFGFVPHLLPLFLATQPFPCGLFVHRRTDSDASQFDADGANCWLLAVDLPALGPIRAVGSGVWPRQELKLLAAQESLPLLQKTEQELRKMLAAAGMELLGISYQATVAPILRLPTAQELYASGVDLRL